MPTITLGNFSNVYPNTTSVNMPFTAVANAPTTYSVVAGTNALSGFSPITDASFSGSIGNLAVALPTNPVPGTYDFNFTVKNANNCQSIVYSKSLTILPQPAIITSFAPKNIAIGEALTITGEGFSTTTAENIVYIGGIKCSVTDATTTSLTVTIPSGVSHSKILYTNTNSKNTAVSVDYLSVKYNWPNNILPNSANFANTQTSITLGSPLFSGNSDRFSIADFENDSKPDVITYTGSPATLRYFKNSSVSTNGGFLASQMNASSLTSISTPGAGGHALLLDIEGDGDLDVFGTVGGYNGSSFFQNNTTSVPLITTRTYSGTSYTGSTNVIDINKDGKTDIISGYTIGSGSGFYTHTNTTAFGSSTFSFNYSTSPSSNPTSMIRPFDMDGDSYEDVLSSQTNTIVVRRNMQNGTFSATPNNLTTSITPFDIRIADMNGDGISDIVYSGGNKIGVLINTSTSGNISTASEFIIQTSNTSTVLGLTLADFNNDGKIDIIASGNSKLSVFLNTTTSSLSFGNERDLGANMNNLSTLVALDLNGDNYMDIVGSDGSTIKYFVYQIVPEITLSSTNLISFNTCQGIPSASQSFNVSGSNLASNITIAAFSGYQYSLDNTTFTSTLSLPFGTGTVTNVPVYVRLAGTFSGTPAGNITLSTTNGNSPTVAVTGTVPPAPYPYDRAVNFTNGGSLVRQTTPSLNFTNFTVEAWIYPTTFNNWAGIISKGAFQLMTTNTGKLAIMFEESWSWSWTQTPNDVLSLNQWQHVAASYNASTKETKLYVNGTLVHSWIRTQNYVPNFSANALAIGTNNGTGNQPSSPYQRNFIGNIDEVKVWNAVRTDAQILANFDTELSGSETGLVAYYKFDQGIGAGNNTTLVSLTDLTSNANHLTPTSMTMNGSTNNILQVGPAIINSPGICLNDTVNLTHTVSGGTWATSDATIISVDTNTGAATANAEGTATITYTFTDNGCTFSTTKLFTVNPLPAAPIATTPINLCQNSTTTALAATALVGHTLQWYTVQTSGTASTTAPIPSTSALGTSIFYVSQRNNTTGCEGPRTAITVNVNAIPTISGVQNMTVGGSTLQLTGSGIPATTNPWVSSNTATATISATGEVTAVAGGSTIITYTNAEGCSIAQSITVVDCAQPFGNALSFGVGSMASNADFVLINSRIFPSQSVTNFTIETWIRPSVSDIIAGTPGNNWLSFLGYSGVKRSPSLYITNNGVLHASWSEGSSTVGTPISASSPTSLTANKWTHIALVKNGTTMKLYADGVEIYSTTCLATLDLPDNAYWLGKSDQQFGGTLDEVRFWSTARTQTQINTTMYTELLGNETGLLANFDFNQGIAGGSNTAIAIVTNKANSALNGTLTNFTKTGTSSNFVANTISTYTISGAATVCANSTAQYTHPVSGGTWSLSNGASATISNTGLLTVVGNENITVSYTYMLNGCSKTATMVVTIASPAPPVSTTPVNLCQNITTTALTATATTGNTLQWYTVATGGTGNLTAPTPSTTSVGIITYYVSQKNSTTNCESSRTAITVNVNEIPTISGVQNMTVGGNTLQLTGSGTPDITTPWASSNTAVATISALGEVTAVAGGTTVITYTTLSGCWSLSHKCVG